MKHKNIKNQTFLFIVLFSLLSVFILLRAEEPKPSPVKDLLKKIEDRIDARVSTWNLTGEGKNLENYSLKTSITREAFQLSTTVKGVEVFSGVKVKGTPLHMKLKITARGGCDVTVKVDNREVGTFSVDGSSGVEVEEEKEVLITDAAAVREYRVAMEVKNQGFKPVRTGYWPPRKTPLAEEGIYFILVGAEISFPQAVALNREVKNWLQSMKTAYSLLNPDFHRYTFTGKPYQIEDKRQTPRERLDRLNDLLQKTTAAFDLDALNRGETKRLEASIRDSYQMAGPLQEYAKEFKVYLVGNAHIDIAWLWRITETVMVAKNTYNTVIENMTEYPELHYAQSQAITYEWIENRYPELFEKIKQAVQKGTWEIVGGMWVEPDCNLISGESWVRQLLFGKNYFKEKFGIDVAVGWNVDSFGYNWNMPQIYKKSGIDVFVTQKIWWNDTTVFPYYIFWWEGVDGTRLLSYFPPMAYDTDVELNRVGESITRYEATTGYKKSLVLYGIGDHGGGPNREILNRVRGYNKLFIAPEFTHAKARDILSGIPNDLGNQIPVWNDELYLEYHRATYTTQAKVKKGNRQSESHIATGEKLASLAALTGSTYPQKELEQTWKLILTNQFHDILPGSSITPVYRDALEAYEKVGKTLNRISSRSLEYLVSKINTRGIKTGIPVVVFNPLSWERSDVVAIKSPYPGVGEEIQVLDNQGKAVPLEIETDEETQETTLVFIAQNLPSLGYRVYTLVKSGGKGKTDVDKGELKAEATTLENRYYKVVVNPVTGNIQGLYSKVLGKEMVAEGKEANVLQVYEDRPERWDAWNIGYTGRKWELNKADTVQIVKQTPVRVVLMVKKSFLGLAKERYSPTEDFPSSFFTQYITLYRDLDRVDIRTEADWWESHMFLKAVFPMGITSDYAAYEIPFAAIRRTTKFETLWEKARFETPALRWADLSGEQYGISLLNDCKYGYDIHGSEMKISLLRAPEWPDPMADRGKHTFTYSLYVHPGKWNEADTVKRAQELNTPLVSVITDSHSGIYPGEMGFFRVEAEGVILDTVKKEEKGAGYIFRLYESKGKAERAELSFFKVPVKVVETDLLEKEVGEIPLTGKGVVLEFKKFEIKTLKVLF